ncbi:MAG: hypothetical protein AABW72_04000 [archaeon]
MSKYLTLTVLITVVLFFSGTYAASPNRETLTISGILKTPDGNFLNGNYNIDFNIINSAGTSVYDENHNGSQAPQVSVSNGYFSVTLGDTNALPSNLFTGDFNLSVSVNSNGWMTPSMRLTAAANAVTASRALDFNVSNDLNVNRFLKIGSDLNVGNKLNVYDFNALYFRISSFFGSDLNAQYYRQSDANAVLLKKADLNNAAGIAFAALNNTDLNLQYYRQTDANTIFAKFSDMNLQYFSQLDANAVLMKKADMNSQYYTQSDANAVLVKQVDLNSYARTISATWTFNNDVNVVEDLNVKRTARIWNLIVNNTTTLGSLVLANSNTDFNIPGGKINTFDLNVGRDLNVQKDANAENLRAIVNLTLGSAIFNQNSTLSAVTLSDDFNAAGTVSGKDLNATNQIIFGNNQGIFMLSGPPLVQVLLNRDLNVQGILSASDLNAAGSVRLGTASATVPRTLTWNAALSAITLDDDFNAAGTISGLDLNAFRNILIGTLDASPPKIITYNINVGNAGAVALNDDLNVAGTISAWDLNASRNLLVGLATSGGLALGDVNIYGSRIAFGSNQADGGTKEIGYNSGISAVTINNDLNVQGIVSAWDLNASRDANIARNLKVNGIIYGNGSGLTGITADVNGKTIGPSDVNADNLILGSAIEFGKGGLARGDANLIGSIYLGTSGVNSGVKLTYDPTLFATSGFGKTGALSINDDVNIGGSILATDINSVGSIHVGSGGALSVTAATDTNQMRIGYGHRSTSPSLDANLLRIFSPTTTSTSHTGLLIEGELLLMTMQGLTGNNDVNFSIALGESAMAIVLNNRKSYLNGGQALDINLVTGNGSAGTPAGAVNILGDLNISSQTDNRPMWVDGNISIYGTSTTGPAWYTCNVSRAVWTCTAI